MVQSSSASKSLHKPDSLDSEDNHMITIPFHGLVVLPGVTFYFKKEFFEELNGELMPEEGEEVLFVMMKQDKDRKKLTKEDFYPIGVIGRISGVDNEQNVGVDALKRVRIDEIQDLNIISRAASDLKMEGKTASTSKTADETDSINTTASASEINKEPASKVSNDLASERNNNSASETVTKPANELTPYEHAAEDETDDFIHWNHFKITYSDAPEIQNLDPEERKKRFEQARRAVNSLINNYPWGLAVKKIVMHWSSMEEMISSVSHFIDVPNEEKYEILAADSLSVRYERMEKMIYEFIETAKVGEEVSREQNEKHEALYREAAIKKQMDLLQKQLDDMHPETQTAEKMFEEKIKNSGMNDTARREAEKVLNRLRQEGENGHEYGLLYDYLDFVTDLSWKKEAFHEFDLKEAQTILDEDHYGLEKVKRRIIQQIAVMSMTKKQSGSILLLVGAPGTGKTSICKSIAKALGREYVRISLGGIRDEAEIRGHRRTYVGAMPGRIMEGIRRSHVSNPVVVLDEVDKLVKEMQGDPSSALLEVLDPEQNNTFTDHYMNVPYDLSDVLFICTANTVDTIPEPLLNRMEVIEFQGYTETEKMEIARRHLLPKALESCGMKKSQLKLSDNVLHKVIADYTMEAGVRGLKKRIDTLCRAGVVMLLTENVKSVTVKAGDLRKMLDRKPILHDKVKEKKQPGIVTGLAWTQAGGDILFMETMLTAGKGEVLITGQLGDVMKESVQVALTLVKDMFPKKAKLFEENNLHIHVPEGAVPKDGPSAGITLVTALASLITDRRVPADIAMTGEVSLEGGVMPIGGLPEKLMAAVRAGVKKVFIPADNIEDLDEVAQEIKDKLEIVPVKRIKDVMKEIWG